MKKFANTKIIALVLVGLFFVANMSFAADNATTNEVTIKTSVSGSESIEKVETIVYLLKGVNSAKVDNDSKVLTVKYNSSQISSFMLVYTVENMGYDAKVIEDKDVTKTTSENN